MRTTCGFGHIYDSDQYAACPYCNRNSRAIVFSESGQVAAPVNVAPVNAVEERTVAPGMGMSPAPVMPVAPASFGGMMQEAIEKTVMPDYMSQEKQREEDSKTVSIFETKCENEPVVAWLVCIKGPDRGKDYRVFGRINVIGRSSENDVVLDKERTVSQRNHAKLAYDPKHNNFQMIPGDGHNVCYLNDEALYVPRLLHAYDVLEFGETQLMFIPFCGDRFSWDQEGAR